MMINTVMEPKDLCRMKMVKSLGGYEGSANSRAEAPCSSTQRPNSAPTSLCGQKHSSSNMTSSFETPYGVVRQTSSSEMEPVRMDSGTSQDNFRRDISIYKLRALPSLVEDGDSSDENDNPNTRRKTKNCGKVKTSKGKAYEKCKMSEEQKQEGTCPPKEITGNTTGCSDILKVIFTCGQWNIKDKVNEDKLPFGEIRALPTQCSDPPLSVTPAPTAYQPALETPQHDQRQAQTSPAEKKRTPIHDTPGLKTPPSVANISTPDGQAHTPPSPRHRPSSQSPPPTPTNNTTPRRPASHRQEQPSLGQTPRRSTRQRREPKWLQDFEH